MKFDFSKEGTRENASTGDVGLRSPSTALEATRGYCPERELVAGVGFAQSPHNAHFFPKKPAHNN